jgi:hypothetical protein
MVIYLLKVNDGEDANSEFVVFTFARISSPMLAVLPLEDRVISVSSVFKVVVSSSAELRITSFNGRIDLFPIYSEDEEGVGNVGATSFGDKADDIAGSSSNGVLAVSFTEADCSA